MPKTELQNQKTKIESEPSLKGALASVFLLGFFLIITWLGVYFLFVDRL
ncbi:cytochrome c oxidase subunit 2A [Cytobacillus sp. Hm23]|nr:cytochrome c oxidase subunit 2A [Cytobacillus sp. IB215665]MDX8366505.1 cytochrome c oxidase subunit 2A [Cytobacillus sp. IB215665]